ncbi:MAG: alpha-hydroxy-acid oxidizing protein [Desulfobacterales bacterium]|nr:alpha-hydroxy-acid oxidizing protein [Desulfobacterales bacterium]
MKELRQKARQRMKGYCRVCPVCDGRACAGQVPGMGGIGTGAAFTANVAALASVRFNMRVIHDVTDPKTEISFLGRTLSLPVLAAPIGGISFNIGGKIEEEEYVQAVLGGCREMGTLGCTGDGVPEFIHETAFSAIRALDGAGIPFIKPWEDKELGEKVQKAADAGATIVGMDLDAAGLFTLRLMGRPVFPRPAEALAEIIGKSDMKWVLKGIMTPEDAEKAVELGADAIVVSNHGGRVLDHTPGTAEVLKAVAAAVGGRITVLADGGVRTGADVLKMLALGADAVMIGRPFSVAAVGGLKQGVTQYLEQLRSELIQAMILTGTSDAASVDAAILF